MGLLGDMMYRNFILMYFILFIRVGWFRFVFFFFKGLFCKTFLNVGHIQKAEGKNQHVC